MTRPANLVTCLLALAALALPLAVAAPAAAEVRFGNNVRIGGHDASNQRFDRRNRGVYHIYEGRPRNPGCSWHSDGRSGRVKICHLQRIRRR
ncbi:conserved exported hypothetical protein [Bosea sp. 62]|uniref:hypothetical protein n=1 Tax=unclassified Bosea (in: a-proteobacteria) TaxID=2653178 RepID=UPI001251CA5C|nr:MULTISPECIES: hypothetical protein [unclassified Bosea (in: a-proteobacteria)]CAD5258081.1 conserved exported hypothetical protein [Bosea sp. 46]CAD5262500.1 conserved exported hypothetical protein [Bosea sp. 21B]CAD5277937.1 conserved exported hypothetical protein [Bosea sp. 7B]VVT58747.1 conserved exported hypothetical protein [Bosea sp. EC-HK365B]VXB59835.1 conserved exported hypothetical protein [Bosea sp. 29B]